MTPVIEVEGLRKVYRRLRGRPTLALDGLDLSVPEGGVFGFLGPNGSGKTTTIRCLLGLVRPNGGRCRILGAPVPAGLPGVIHRVASIVEEPALFPGFSGRRNLELLAGVTGIDRRAVDRLLEQVGLAERAGDLVKGYSLGMRQRLGLAAALLKDPAVLVLDEPANGLDPAGIREVRDLLRRLGSEGRTVFVSSHILSEVQQTCDRVAILNRGRCVASGRVDEVLSRRAGAGMVVTVDDAEAGVRALAAAGIDARLDGGLVHAAVPPADAARITRALAERDLWVTALWPEPVSLEDVFLELTAAPEPPPSP